MARLLRSHRSVIHICPAQSPSFSFLQRRSALTSSKPSEEILPESPLDANIVRILGNDIGRRLEFDPPHEHAVKYKSFTVQDRYGEKCITMSRKFGDNEDIRIKATMFDGYARDPKDIGNKTLHISLFADISKGSDSETWQFACSVWPGRLEVQWVSPLRSNTELARPYFGGEMRHLKRKLKKGILEYLEARDIDGELSIFLHHFMKNKDRVERLQWLTRVKSYVHK